jgi:leucyl aminopeptidase
VEKYKPSAVVDVATLTGAMVIALGHVAPALFANNDALARELIAAGETAWDRAWHMPLWDDYQEALKSNFADIPTSARARAARSPPRASCRASPRHTPGRTWTSPHRVEVGAEKGATGRPVAMLSHFLVKRAGVA